MPKTYSVIRDTREQEGYYFDEDGWATTEKKLDTGDYSLVGYENILCIERKRSTGEISGNITEKRFEREIQRMAQYKYKFIICEFSFQDVLDFPRRSGIPSHKLNSVKITSKFIQKKLFEYQLQNIHVLFCDNPYGGKVAVEGIIKRVVERE